MVDEPDRLAEIEERWGVHEPDFEPLDVCNGDVKWLIAEIKRLKVEGTPAVMHEIDKAFYNLTVKERDLAWIQVDRLRAERDVLAAQIEKLTEW